MRSYYFLMTLSSTKHAFLLVYKCFVFAFIFESCTAEKKIYKSDCNDAITFKRVTFSRLIDSLKNYDQQYVEVAGTYKEDKGQSALFNDSLFVDHSNKHALWINFSQDCPLYLSGTHNGLFETSNGQFMIINNKKVIIRGKVDMHNTGKLNQYKGCIDRISFVKL